MPEKKNPGGRPRGTNVKDLERLEAKLTDMLGGDRTLKAEFFGRIIASAVGTMGHMAFADDFLESLENNAEKVWRCYLAILEGRREKELAKQVEDALAAAREAYAERDKAIAAAKHATDLLGSEPEPDPELTEGIVGEEPISEDAPSDEVILENA